MHPNFFGIKTGFKAVIIIFICAAVISLIEARIQVKNSRLFDSQGGQRIFHGLNLVQKNFPYHTRFNETDMQRFKQWGMNGIRLGVMWPGVQPLQGTFNETYLQIMKQTVDLAGKYGIYTLVQFHQDLFSRKFCADGVPLWAIPDSISKSFPQPLYKRLPFDPQTGFPQDLACSKYGWGTYYFTYAVNKGFDHLWNNKGGLLQKFASYWRKVAQTFKGNEFVIGYQLVNEPWPGNIFRNIFNMVPRASQLNNMAQAYDYLATQIRTVDPLQNICYQPATWDNNFQVGFQHPPQGFQYANSSILCYHYYRPPTVVSAKSFMKARMSDLKRLKSAGILSEFYTIEPYDNSQIMDQCDQHGQSWLGWLYQMGQTQQFSFKRNSINMFQNSTEIKMVNQVAQQLITRTYAQRIAGQDHQQKFDKNTKKFFLSYYHFGNKGETIVYFSKQHHYKKGFSFECLPQNDVQCVIQDQIYLKVRSPKNGIRVYVTIEAL